MYQKFSPLAWTYSTNIYEVNVRQYTPEGTFAAFEKELPRLRAMGVETLWFMPITPISEEKRLGVLGSYYACSDYTTTNPEFGSPEDFKQLVTTAHKLGFKVLIDWVANHTGWDHVWTRTHPGYYKRNAADNFYDANGWEDVIDLNYYDQLMRAEMIGAMIQWVKECDIDGFRCDMAHLIPLDFWRQARTAVDAVKPLFWLAETEVAQYMDVFDCCYTWQWMHATDKLISGGVRLKDLLGILDSYNKDFPTATTHLFFTANHDENSWNGTEYEKYGDAARMLAVFSCVWNGVPLIYSGQELPNVKRLRFFEKDTIDWNGQYQLADFYKALLSLRERHPAVKAGMEALPHRIATNVDDYVLAFLRRNHGHDLLVLLNFSPNTLFVQLPEGYVKGTYTNIFTGAKVEVIPHHSFELKAWDYLVLEQ